MRKHKKTFGRSQFTALLATVVDYSALLFLVECLGIYYLVAVAVAACLGAFTNFFANRAWAFASNGILTHEMGRYALVSAGGLGWNIFLVWLVTEKLGLVYYQSKIVVAILVGFFWNYPLHKYWVFLHRE